MWLRVWILLVKESLEGAGEIQRETCSCRHWALPEGVYEAWETWKLTLFLSFSRLLSELVWFCGVFLDFFFHLVFIVLQLWLPLLTDKSILPLLGKVVLWKSAKSGMGFQTKGALEPVWFLSSWKSVLMQAQTRRTRGSAGSRCWYMLSGWAWSCVDRQSKPAARGQRKDWDHHSFILRSFYVSRYCPAPQPRMKEGPEHPKWLICWKAPRCICSPSPHQDGWTKKKD